MPFEPGKSGNPSGQKKHELQFRAALTRALAQDNAQRLRDCVEKVLTLASNGEPWAVQFLADRLDGKAAQSVTLAGDAENPLRIIAREIVDPKTGNDAP